METPYLATLKRNKADVEAKIEKFSDGNPEHTQHLPRLRHHLKDLNAEIDKYDPAPVVVGAVPEKPRKLAPVNETKIKKNAGRK